MELLILALLILLNGFFSMSEMAVATSRRARLQQRADDGHAGSRLVLRLSDEPGAFLATVQVGITTIGILSGAFGEQAIVGRLTGWLAQFAPIADYAGSIATVAMVLLLTYFSVVFGEIVPKRIALLSPERIAGAVAGPMLMLERIVKPVVALLSVSSNALLRLIGATARGNEPPVTEEEIRMMLRQGTAAGVFERGEEAMVGNVFRLGDIRVTAIMTPRRDIIHLDVNDLDAAREVLRNAEFETLPVCNGDMEDVVGMLETKRLARALLDGGALDLRRIVAPATFVPETVTPAQLLGILRARHAHSALVVDEYGSVEGIVTLTDVLEAIVGSAPGPAGGDDDAVQREDGSWLLDGMLSSERVADLLEAPRLFAGRHDYHTLGGFVMDRLGRVPATGDTFIHDGWRFEVVDMDGHRVDRVLAGRIEPPDDSG